MPWTVVITGPPASGKTTLRSRLISCIGESTQAVGLGIDDVLRRMFANGELGEVATVQADGALILSHRGPFLDIAMQRLVSWRVSIDAPAIIEAPVHAAFLEALLSQPELLAETLIVELTAPVSVRLERNSSRGRDRISTEAVRTMPASISAGPVRDSLIEYTAAIVRISTIEPPEAVLSAALKGLVQIQPTMGELIGEFLETEG